MKDNNGHKPILLLTIAGIALLLGACGGLAPSSSSDSSILDTSEEESSSKQEESSSIQESSEESFSSIEENKPIYLYNDNSRLISFSFNEDSAIKLPTYHHEDYGDVPFVDINDFFTAVSSTGLPFLPTGVHVDKIGEELYAINAYNAIIGLIDTDDDIVTLKRSDFLSWQSHGDNNHVGGDIFGPNDDPLSCVHTSIKSKYLTPLQDEVYYPAKYNIDLVSQEGKMYAPLNFLSMIFLKDATTDIVYNGIDYYCSAFLNQTTPLMMGGVSSYYATNDAFAFDGGVAKKVDAQAGEKYRFAVDKGDEGYLILSFIEGSDEVSIFPSSTVDGSKTDEYKYTVDCSYIEKQSGIFVSYAMEFMGMVQTIGSFKIPAEDSYFGKMKRSDEVARFGYDLLRFQFESIYGLREDFFAHYEVSTIEDFCLKKELKGKLLSNDSSVYDDALATFLMYYVDDCHTKYTGTSIYSGLKVSADKVSKPHWGPRRSRIGGLIETYGNDRKEATGIEDKDKQQGLFIEGKTAVIRFDGFTGGATMRNVPVDLSKDISTLMVNATTDGFYASFIEIDKHPEIENIVIDLTNNTGGVAATLPYLQAYFTDDPKAILFDTTTNTGRELHYNVDLNRNGVFHEKEDTYKGKYEFFVLTSGVSFSCGNALPTFARQAGVTIIGEQSAGGACAVGSFTDSSGTLFNTSMPSQISYYDKEGNLIHNDAGIPVDYAYPKEYWYDLPKLDEFVSGLPRSNN